MAGLATLISIFLGLVSGPHASIRDLLLLGGSSMSAASLASALLGSVMIGVVMISQCLNINPDNVATPIASSLGDLITLSFLSCIAYGLYRVGGEGVVHRSIASHSIAMDTPIHLMTFLQ